ncbi:hypothetical protein N7466_004477 [Penicillium verhagenii]|uniref:uncharacterized protein n=1 Tax=Penicillium verhagenii TaxID=1562060 RepID=UPI002544E6B1|nr:uncharacterized protein N7466_004477 [Penicillium verhagenii]KAJ5934930.1 hypothetical protein N7466_004477 [Penicillium verhagenii]
MAVDSRDPDGDSEMASSVDSASDIANNGARTPTYNPQASSVPASELSPPGSQPSKVLSVAEMNSSKTIEPLTGNGLSTAANQDVGAWNSKRSREEYARAMEHVVDKDFNLDKFGDPFDERDMHEPLR